MENQSGIPEYSSEPKRHHHRSGNIWWALVLIITGAILFVQNLHIANFTFNWWALFIFIPVIGSLSSAWSQLRDEGYYSTRVGGNIGSAVFLGVVATILMFGMDWTLWWPLVVMAAGFSVLLTGIGRLSQINNRTLSAFARLSGWIGLGAIVLGLGFLVQTLPITSWQVYLIPRWWAVPILITGAGALVNMLVMFFQNGAHMNWAAWSMGLIAVFIIGIGILALFALDWNLLLPIVLIACGLVVLAGFFTNRD
jgi:hypothetical protein